MNQDELGRLHREAEQELKRYAGVVGVAFGQKRRGGKPTGEIGFCVYVLEKKDPSSLAPEELLPREYAGFPVDVDELPDPVKLAEVVCADHDQHSPLIGGISITNMRPDANGEFGVGTLGFLATINGEESPDNVVLVSNHHVLMANGARVGDKIYQQRLLQATPGGIFGPDITNRNDVAKIHREGADGNVPFHYPGEPPQDPFFVDCTSAKVDISVSSWCHTNCGQSIANEIRGLALPGGNVIVDVDRVAEENIHDPQHPYAVVKVGRVTGRTEGVVSRLNIPMKHGEGNVIEITATKVNCNGLLEFLEEGDSGSALLNAAGKLVGLCFAVERTNRLISYACHIHPVLELLGVTPISNQNPPDSRITSSETDVVVDERTNQALRLRERFLESAEGRRIAALVDEHRGEVVELVNHNRRVTVAWHRSHGPAFLNRAIVNARELDVPLPRAIEGVTREALLVNMEQALADHGSAGLRLAMERNREEVLAYAEHFDSLHELVDELAERRPDE